MSGASIGVFESILHASGCYEYLSKFKKHGVDIQVLPILKEADLEIIGINDENQRKTLIKLAGNLQTPKEGIVDICFDEEYATTVIKNITQHLHLLNAYFSYVQCRKDIIHDDVKLLPATMCLKNCTISLKLRINEFYQKCNDRKRKKRKNKWIILGSFVVTTSLSCYIFKKIFF